MEVKVKFYLTGSGRSPVEDFLEECSEGLRGDFLDAVSLLSKGESLAMPLSRNLSSVYRGLHELRLKDKNGQVRVFYFLTKIDGIYLLHAFRKKTQELPKKEIEVALKRIKEI